MNKSLLITCASLLCFACSVGPNYKQPKIYTDEQINDTLNWQKNTSDTITREWYKSFNDSSLNHLIAIGLENSPNIKVALEKMRQSRYQLYIDRAGFLPTFDMSGKYNKSNQGIIDAFSSNNEYYQVGIDASWEIDIWGGQRRLTESSAAMLKSAAANFDNVKLSLAAEIASQYINWRLTEKLLSITEENLRIQRNIFNLVEEKYRVGLADDLDYEQARSVLQTTQMQLPELRANKKSYQNALAILVGKRPSEIVKENSNLIIQKPIFDKNKLYNFSADIVRNRPDVQIIEQQLIGENALIGNAIANLFPSISLSAFLGYQNKTLSPIFGSDYNVYTTGGIINLPLLHWGELVNQVEIQKSVTRQTLALYEASLLTAIVDISNAITSVEEENIRNNSAKSSMISTSKILDLSKTKYQNGLINFSDLLTAEQNKLSAEQEYMKSNANIYLNLISFYKAVGGGFSINRNNQAYQKDETALACVPYKG